MLPLLIDENLNHRIVRGLRRAVPNLDCLLAVEAGLKAWADPEVLAFAAERGRILITHDLRTIPRHAYDRIRRGLPMPGIVAVPHDLAIGRAIDDLVLLVSCVDPLELQSFVLYLPI